LGRSLSKTMKNFSLKLISVTLLGATLFFNSCLKDPGRLSFAGSQPVVEFPTAYTNANANVRVWNPAISSTPQKYPVDLNIASRNVLGQDVTVTVAIDPQGLVKLQAIKKAKGDSTVFILPPSNSFNFNPTVTIKKGTRIDSVVLNVTSSGLDLTKAYAVPLIITAVSPINVTISGNFGEAYVVIGPKNQYDGIYHATGTFIRAGVSRAIVDAAANSAFRTKTVTTINGNTVQTELGDLKGSGYLMNLTVNPDNSVTIAPAGLTPALDFPSPSSYNPATKTFTLSYSYSAGTRVGNEKVAYFSARP